MYYIRPVALFLALSLWLPVFSQSTCSYNFRKRITFDPTKVSGSSDLTDFPVLIKIASDNDLRVTGSGGHVQNANGYDIIFTSADGTTLLDHQLTRYVSTSGALECWVKVPVLSTSVDTDIYMYYGNSAVTTNQSSTNTWSNGYAGVWHLDNNLNNSTATSGLNGTNNGSSNTGTSMFGGNARDFDGSSDYVDITPYNAAYDQTSAITVSAWIRLGTTGADQKIAGNQNNATGGWKFGVFSDNKIEFEIRNSSNSPFLSRSAGGGTSLSNNTWYYVVGEFSDAGDFINTYLNGSLDRNYSTTEAPGASNGTLKFGSEPYSSDAFFDGIMDEIRISSVIRSASWVATEYANQNSPTTFYSISAEPKVWIGGTSTNFGTNSNWLNNDAPGSDEDVIINNGSNQPILAANTQVNSIFIKTGATLSLSNRRLSVRSDITNCGTISGGTGEVRCNSGTANVQTQYFSGSGTYNLTNLVVANTFGTDPALVLTQNVNVSGDLTLTSGVVYTTASSLLALGSGATSTSGSASSYVSGPMTKAGTTNFVFPVGKGGNWRRAAVSNITSNSTFRAEYFDTPYANVVSINSPLQRVSRLEYWQVDRVSGTGNANLALYWESATASGITSCPNLTIARFNGSSWDERAATTSGGSSCTGTGIGIITTTAVVTAFSPFTFASKLSGVNPLPIELVKFDAACDGTNYHLTWSTASEKDNAYFLLEKSTDGEEWMETGRVGGAGTSVIPHDYVFSDPVVIKDPLYYRLVQVDKDGTRNEFNTVFADCYRGQEHMLLFPNPASHELSIQFELTGAYGSGSVTITDNLGKECLRREIELVKGKNLCRLQLDLNPGAYFVSFHCKQLVLPARKLIVK
jgi:hypothetical protein